MARLAKLAVLAPLLMQCSGVAASARAIFIASVLVQEAEGVILPVALLGLAGSFTPLAAPIYLGAFIGMTSKTFSTFQFLQSSLFSATLLKLGILEGFGGKLGLIAFLGVLFGM